MPQQSSGGGFLSGLMGSVAQGKQAYGKGLNDMHGLLGVLRQQSCRFTYVVGVE
jgi:hypothetical protein